MSPSRSSDGLPFENSKRARINGINVHYRVWLPPAGNTDRCIFLIHGPEGSTYSWQRVAERLTSSSFLAAAADLPGFGFTEAPRTFPVGYSLSGILWQLLDVVGQESTRAGKRRSGGKWTLAGASTGARAASQMAISQPERCNRLVLVDAAVSSAPELPGFPALGALRTLLSGRLTHVLRSREGMSSLLTSGYGRPPLDEEVEEHLRALEASGTVGLFEELRRREPVDLAAISIPVLLVWGEHDTWVDRTNAVRLFNSIKRSEIHIVGAAAHLPAETHPEELAECIAAFAGRAIHGRGD